MKQYDIINSFTKVLIDNKYLICAFLMGSYGRKREDEYSNIDFYFVLNNEYEEDFYHNYLSILNKYGKIIYHKNNNNKDLIIVYKEDVMGLILNINIHITDLSDVVISNDILSLYDPNHLLDKLNDDISFTYKEIGKKIDNISLNSLEFMRMYKRNDIAIMFDLTNKILNDYVCITRYYKDKTSSKLEKKEFLAVLSKEERLRFVNILKKIRIDTLKEAIILMMEDVSNILMKLDLHVASQFDYDFYMYMLNKIKTI